MNTKQLKRRLEARFYPHKATVNESFIHLGILLVGLPMSLELHYVMADSDYKYIEELLKVNCDELDEVNDE